MAVQLFDANYYRVVNPDLANLNDAQARSHFQNYGIAEGRKFSPLVDLEFYRYNNPDLTLVSSQGDSELFEHLQKNGLAEGRRFSPFFDVNFYLSNNPDLVAADFNNKQAFEHFQESGIAEGRHASVLVLFDPGYYLSQNRQLVAAGINNNQKAFEHFQSYGYAEGRRSSPLFDRNGIEALVGYSPARWNVREGGTLTFSFVTAASGSGYKGTETGVGELSEAIKNNIRNILYNLYTPILPFNLVEVPDTDASHGQIRFMFSNGKGVPGFYAYTYELGFDDLDGDVHLSRDAEGDSVNAFSGGAGTYGYATLIHEIGHAFGLKHPGNYNGESGEGRSPFLPYGEDNNMNTVMTYNDSLSDPSPSTPMAYDIRALQYLYGANNFNNTDTIYKFDRSNLLNQKKAIWDSNGIDTIDFSALPPNETYYYFDMNEGGHLTTGDARNAGSYSPLGDRTFATYRPDRYATAIAYGTIIENLIGSQGNDYIIGNQADNLIRGEAGYDILVGSGGADTLVGGGDADTFVLTPAGGAADLIMDFIDGQDRLNLQGGLTPNSLTFTQGTGENGNNTFVQIAGNDERLAILVGVNASAIGVADFTSI